MNLAQELFSVEIFVCACRAFPAIPSVLYESPASREKVHGLLTASGDASLLTSISTDGTSAGSWEHLSPREREVLLLVSDGMTNAEIAARLFVAEATVKVHVRHVFEKLGVRSRTSAALRVPQYARSRSN